MRSADQIRRYLKDHNIKAVAQDIGVHMNSVYAFMNNQRDPLYSTVEKLNAYIERKEQLYNETNNNN